MLLSINENNITKWGKKMIIARVRSYKLLFLIISLLLTRIFARISTQLIK